MIACPRTVDGVEGRHNFFHRLMHHRRSRLEAFGKLYDSLQSNSAFKFNLFSALRPEGFAGEIVVVKR